MHSRHDEPLIIRKNADKTAPAQPDYRVFAGEIKTEIGGRWIMTAKSSGKEYISLTFADPQIGPRRIYAILAPVKGRKGRYALLRNPGEGEPASRASSARPALPCPHVAQLKRGLALCTPCGAA
ncbi:MAG: DUF736 domain-containing protein [Hyphomonas sp.]|uniref:DUF736 family protein n=1 Tax=Hyphomonas sp. TaxID=87 RepID=UPI001823312F|nr:DUF736 family protein [Hyphomonas sp.]MBA3068105.1 DUF736 domain-containing protein [Hyphomonas sp.]